MKKLIIMCTDVRFASAIVNYCQSNLAENSELIIESYAGCVSEYAQNSPHALFENIKYHNIDKVYIFLHDDCGYYNHVYGVNENMHLNMHYQMRDAITVASILSSNNIDFEIITCKINSDDNLITIMDNDYPLDNNTMVEAVVIYPASTAVASFALIDSMGIKYDRYSYYADPESPNFFGRKSSTEKMLFDINIISLQKHNAKEIIFMVNEQDNMEELFCYFTNNFLPFDIRKKCQIKKIHDNQPTYV